MDNNELTSGGIGIFSGIDSIQEFKVLTYNYSAEYGTRAGPTVLVTTKSGANDFHGSLFEFLRNTSLDAKSFFATTPEKFNLNQYGGSLGGPMGAAIGAGAGVLAGVISSVFFESPQKKAHNDIQQIYGVNIPQNSGTIKLTAAAPRRRSPLRRPARLRRLTQPSIRRQKSQRRQGSKCARAWWVLVVQALKPYVWKPRAGKRAPSKSKGGLCLNGSWS